jgi:hypothetical protein
LGEKKKPEEQEQDVQIQTVAGRADCETRRIDQERANPGRARAEE